MAIDFKYRIHEVAKDFGMTSKMIGQILTDYVAAPKNHMQVLEDSELDIIFEYLTQNNQVGSIAEIFAPEPVKAEAPKAEAPAQEPVNEKKAETPAPGAVKASGSQPSGGRTPSARRR